MSGTIVIPFWVDQQELRDAKLRIAVFRLNIREAERRADMHIVISGMPTRQVCAVHFFFGQVSPRPVMMGHFSANEYGFADVTIRAADNTVVSYQAVVRKLTGVSVTLQGAKRGIAGMRGSWYDWQAVLGSGNQPCGEGIYLPEYCPIPALDDLIERLPRVDFLRGLSPHTETVELARQDAEELPEGLLPHGVFKAADCVWNQGGKIALARIRQPNGIHYVIGVPGQHHEQYRHHMARMGLRSFHCPSGRYPKRGEPGHWLYYI